MRIAVIGSRNFSDRGQVFDFVRSLPRVGTVIVTGGAMGVDSWAEEEAKRQRISRCIHEPQAERCATKRDYVAALFARNKTIVDDYDRVVAFWDGESTGTERVIEYARSVGKIVDADIRRAR